MAIARFFFAVTVSGCFVWVTGAFALDSVVVFPQNTVIGWYNDSSESWVANGITYSEKGRIMEKKVTLPAVANTTKITATINIRKFADDMDRLGNLHVKLADGTRVELIHLITSFGGTTDHPEDVSYPAPLLQGQVTLCFFLDIWRGRNFIIPANVLRRIDDRTGGLDAAAVVRCNGMYLLRVETGAGAGWCKLLVNK